MARPFGVKGSIDADIGSRVRLRRALLGLSQKALARALGITFQQVQKYESGANRIAGGRFFDLARVLDVPVSHFFEQHGEEGLDKKGTDVSGYSAWTRRQETIELLKVYYAISDGGVRSRIRDLIRAIARK